jgi:hypothetical protein
MKNIVLTIMVALVTLLTSNKSEAFWDAQVVWHGHDNQLHGYDKGWWESTWAKDTYASWWYYSPINSATWEVISIVKNVRRPSNNIGFLFGSTSYCYQMSFVGEDSGGNSDIRKSSTWLDTEEGEGWWTLGDNNFSYVYGKIQVSWIIRISFATPYSNVLPGGKGTPPLANGSSCFEIVVKNSNGSVMGNYPIHVNGGTKTIDVHLDFTSMTQHTIAEWPGAPNTSIMSYFNYYTPRYPNWSTP